MKKHYLRPTLFYILFFNCICACTYNKTSDITNTMQAKSRVIVLLLDPTKSAIGSYGIERLTERYIFSLIDKTARHGGADIYIYGIDEDCRNNQPLFIKVPGIPTVLDIKEMQIGDEQYEEFKGREIEKFKKDSINGVKMVDRLKENNQKEIEFLLNNIYSKLLDWTDIVGAINNAIETVSTEKYKSYVHKEIIGFSDFEQSLPKDSEYQPMLQVIPTGVFIAMISGTTGQKSILKGYSKIPNFDLYLLSIQ